MSAKKKGAFQTILLAWLIAGTLDISSAIINVYFSFRMGTERLFQFIASALLGKNAFNGGWETAALGLCIHYFIALFWTVTFFLLYPEIKWLHYNKFISGIAYGAFVWIVMNLIVRPLTLLPKQTFAPFQTILGILILMFLIGLPISIIISHYYSKDQEL